MLMLSLYEQKSMYLKWSSLCVALDRMALGLATLTVVPSVWLSSLITALWTLYLHCIISCWLPFMGLIGVLPTISEYYFALSKIGVSYTNLTNMAQEGGNVGLSLYAIKVSHGTILFSSQWAMWVEGFIE